MITILHRGGYAQMITILHRGGGVSRDPQKWLRNMCTTPKWRGGQFIFWYPLRFFQRCIKGYPDMRCISLLSHKEVWEWPLSPKYPTFAKNAEHHAAQTARHDSFHHFYENIEGTLVEDVCNHKYLDQIVFIRKEQSLLCDWMGWR